MRAWIFAGETSVEMERLRARLLHIILLTLSVCASVAFATSYSVGYRNTARALALAMPALLIAFWLSRRRQVMQAGILIVAVLQILATFISFKISGINNPATILHALTILIASLLLNRGLYLLYLVLAVGNAIVLVYLELTERLVFDQPATDAGMMIAVPAMLLACGLIPRVMTENLRHNLVRARTKTSSLLIAETEQRRLVAELEAKNTELEHLARIVSHDLRSPLLTIRGLLGFLEKDARAGNMDRVRSDIQRVTQAAAKMQELLGELQALSEVGQAGRPPESVPFGELADEAVRLVSGRLERHGVEVAIAPGLPAVEVVRARVVSVLQNLVENAVKFMGDESEPRIEIGAEDDGGGTVFFVRDNGTGIAPEQQDKIFGLFERLDPAVEGSGMGLALVRRIVEVHGGRIWVESDGSGTGATFRFTLGTSPQNQDGAMG